MDTFVVANMGFSSKLNKKIANSVDPDETARYKLSHMDLHCLQRCLYWSVGRKRLTITTLESFQEIPKPIS